jgi:hypothetical protein
MSAYTWRRDAVWVALVIALFTLFFWRLLTPVPADQASLERGDFSDQFVTFGAYQYARFSEGEVPLWNPYNNGGLPFIADTQAAVFYPPRLLTIALSSLSGTGWTYHALELEMMAHILFYALSMGLLLRRMTLGRRGSVVGAAVAAIAAGFGGWATGYAPLQLALLEAGIWLPLAMLGLWEASRDRFRPSGLVLTGIALGLSWLAGHPQTSFFLTYLTMAWWGYLVFERRWPWHRWLVGTIFYGALSLGLVAVTLLSGVEYLIQTSRSELGLNAKAHGFPLRDFIQVILPHVVSLFSPLYIGVAGFVLALAAVVSRAKLSLFWGTVALFSLLFSLGGNGFLYLALYDVVPGLRFFRGQERIAYLFANSMAILAGLGAVAVLDAAAAPLRRIRWLGWLMVALLGVMMVVSVVRMSDDPQSATFLTMALLSLMAGTVFASSLSWLRWRSVPIMLVALVSVELITVNIDRDSNFDPIPPGQQIVEPSLLKPILADTDMPFRVDGKRVLGGNYGSYYGLMDIQGISPLFLTGTQEIAENGLPDELSWELFAVRYVFSPVSALNVPWEFLGEGVDAEGSVNLFRLTAPRPFAHLVYQAVTVDSDLDARLTVADPAFDPRNTVVLHTESPIVLPSEMPEGYGTTVVNYEPEYLKIVAQSPENAILSIAQVDYPGWHATLDGVEIPILRAYGGLIALPFQAGTHEIELRYDPLSYRIGALMSVLSWAGVLFWALWMLMQKLRKGRSE